MIEQPWQFQSTPEEWEAAARFMRRHRKVHGRDRSAAGGRFSFIFTPTGLGTAVEVHCAECRRKRDVTDYGSW